MNSIREHWDEIVAIRQQLIDKVGPDGAVYLMSVPRRKLGVVGGRISVATVPVAALMLALETHREAEPAEAAQWKAQQLKQAAEIKAKQDRATGNVNVGEQIIAALTALSKGGAVEVKPPEPRRRDQKAVPEANE